MIITEGDIIPGYFETSREPSRRAYIIKYTGRSKYGKDGIVSHQLRFLPEEYRTLGRDQAREAVIDSLLVKLNKEN
jgi:hypothetical protein